MFVNWHNVASVTSGPVIVSSVHCLHTRHPTGSSPSLVSVSSPSEKKRFLGGTSNEWDKHPPRPELVVSRQTALSSQPANSTCPGSQHYCIRIDVGVYFHTHPPGGIPSDGSPIYSAMGMGHAVGGGL